MRCHSSTHKDKGVERFHLLGGTTKKVRNLSERGCFGDKVKEG